MALPLKSGADLYNQQLIRAAIWNYSADGLEPSEYATGLIYFNTNPSSNMYQKLRFRTGTDWKTIAFAEDLDVAANKDFLALKEKVDLLSGEVDTDAIINNMKEVTAFLSGFAEDANLMTMLDDKLSKSQGGTVNGLVHINVPDVAAAIEINTTSPQETALHVYNNGESKAWFGWHRDNGAYIYNSKNYQYLGIKDDGTPHFTNKTLLHSGNVGEYAVKIDGSSRMKAEKGLKWDSSEGGNSDNFDSSFFVGRDASEGSALATSKRPYTAVLNVGGTVVGGYRFQLASYVGPTHNELYYRGYNNNGSEWKDWKTIAFTDSNVASAQALVNAQGVAYAYAVDDTNVVLGATNKRNLFLDGIALHMRYGNSATLGFILNSLGNVTIGGSDFAGTGAKFVVTGDVRIQNTTSTNGNSPKLYLSGLTDSSSGNVATGPALQAIQTGYYGRKRLAFFQHDADDYTTEREVMSILPNGNVGIGLTSPSAKLHVSQDIVANGTIACKGVAAEGSMPVGTVDKWAGSIAIGTKSQTYTHGLGTTDITVALYEKNGNEWVQILTDVDIVNANTIRVTFGANTTVEHRIVVMG